MRLSVAHRGQLARSFIAACLSGLVAIANAAGPMQAQDGFTTTGLHYRSEGRGPTVVLIHAFHMDLREWDDVVPLVVATNRRQSSRSRARAIDPAASSSSA